MLTNVVLMSDLKLAVPQQPTAGFLTRSRRVLDSPLALSAMQSRWKPDY